MREPRYVKDVIAALPPSAAVARLPAPPYVGQTHDRPHRVGLAVESMRRHTSDEGFQLFQALETAGYKMQGHAIKYLYDCVDRTDVREILQIHNPLTVVMQDKREWEGKTAGSGFDPREKFTNVTALRERPDVFKLTILKDAHHDLIYHRQSADEMGCHGWIVYYHPRVVTHLAPYVRPEHLIRTWHTVDPAIVPPYSPDGRHGCLISGAVSGVYPLRRRLIGSINQLPDTRHLTHPGYRRDGYHTPTYLKVLSGYRVAVCTSSIYSYALRKIVEATACGCRVITDLAVDEVMPEIDGNLYRVHPDSTAAKVGDLIRRLNDDYDPGLHRAYAERALTYYDYRAEGRRLANGIEALRQSYKGDTQP